MGEMTQNPFIAKMKAVKNILDNLNYEYHQIDSIKLSYGYNGKSMYISLSGIIPMNDDMSLCELSVDIDYFSGIATFHFITTYDEYNTLEDYMNVRLDISNTPFLSFAVYELKSVIGLIGEEN